MARTSTFTSVVSLIASFTCATGLSAAALAESAGDPPSVIELFTSQGCSSCPPADRLLGEMARKPGVIAMSYPVTYWDYLGWKDTLARPENGERQRAYAAARGDWEIYTPQAIVNGVKGCVGNDPAKLQSALDETAQSLRKAAVSLQPHIEHGRLVVEAGGAPEGSRFKTGKVWVASIVRSTDVAIEKGENAGKRITYTNVVRKLTEAGPWQGAPTSYAVPLTSLALEDGETLVVFLQADDLGPIVGAARVGG